MKTRKLFLLVGFLLFVGMAFALSPSTVMATVEDCDNGIDDDKDKLVDCKDPDCAKSVKCEEDVTADCSPGFYKNNLLDGPHPVCTNGIDCVGAQQDLTVANCEFLVPLLSAELGATKAQREGAKAILDACFGTAENSPCEDDD